MTPAQLDSLAAVHKRVNGGGKASSAPQAERGTLVDLQMFAAMPRTG